MQNAMLELGEGMTSFWDTADGIKAELERREWSPTMAEAVAGEWLRGAMKYLWEHQ